MRQNPYSLEILTRDLETAQKKWVNAKSKNPLNRQEIYSAMYALNSIYFRILKTQFRHLIS
jgi:hypothetical protein